MCDYGDYESPSSYANNCSDGFLEGVFGCFILSIIFGMILSTIYEKYASWRGKRYLGDEKKPEVSGGALLIFYAGSTWAFYNYIPLAIAHFSHQKVTSIEKPSLPVTSGTQPPSVPKTLLGLPANEISDVLTGRSLKGDSFSAQQKTIQQQGAVSTIEVQWTTGSVTSSTTKKAFQCGNNMHATYFRSDRPYKYSENFPEWHPVGVRGATREIYEFVCSKVAPSVLNDVASDEGMRSEVASAFASSSLASKHVAESVGAFQPNTLSATNSDYDTEVSGDIAIEINQNQDAIKSVRFFAAKGPEFLAACNGPFSETGRVSQVKLSRRQEILEFTISTKKGVTETFDVDENDLPEVRKGILSTLIRKGAKVTTIHRICGSGSFPYLISVKSAEK